MRPLLLALALAACVPPVDDPAAPPWTPDQPLDDTLRMNQLQAVGTHNSYHLRPTAEPPPVWDYEHAPLDVQLGDLGVRQFELDVHWDAEVGAFAVHHVPLIDAATSCAWLADCLGTLKVWSDAHRGHHPLMLLIEPKDEVSAWQQEDFLAALDRELLAVWPEERLITPTELRGDHATLREGVVAGGWPTLGASRGRMIVQLHTGGPLAEAYTAGWTSTARPLFTDVPPADPFAAFVAINDAVGDFDLIQASVAEGLLVRTRADSDRSDFEDGDRSRLEAALASGAQAVSTDHPSPDEATGYVVQIPGGTPSRCNPLTAPAECTSEAIEDPGELGP